MNKLQIAVERLKNSTDVVDVKKEIRTLAKEVRRGIDPEEKAQMERIIAQRLTALKEYKEANTVLCYFSNEEEVGTHLLLDQAWNDNKIVAIPKCREDLMLDFYAINSYQDIKRNPSGFGEPNENKLIDNFKHSICIVPGLIFDYRGSRIGYGTGYYDRFLKGYSGCKIGITFSLFMQRALPRERFDQRMDYLITEKFTKCFAK